MFKFIILLFSLNFIFSDISKELPHGFTEEELKNKSIIQTMGRYTDPPSTPIRNIAEFERMEGVLIRYPFGISNSVISEMSEDVTIYCLVSSSSQNSEDNARGAADSRADMLAQIKEKKSLKKAPVLSNPSDPTSGVDELFTKNLFL